MKLENKFFNSFFYPFLIGVFLSMVVVSVFLSVFTNNYLDKKTGENIVDLEKKFAKVNINSVNALLTTTLLKVQASINEQILFYQKLANKAKKNNINNYTINSFLKCAVDIEDSDKNKFKYMAFWFKDNNTRKENFENESPEKLQLIVYSNIFYKMYIQLWEQQNLQYWVIFLFLKKQIYLLVFLYNIIMKIII